MDDQILTELKNIKIQLDALTKEIELLKLLISNIQQLEVHKYYDNCIDGLGHEYPTYWYSIVPPACRKCGKQI